MGQYVRVTSTIDLLAADLRAMPAKNAKALSGVVREGIKTGNKIAQENARRSSGTHGKLYPRTFSAEMHGPTSSLTGGFGYSGEYGPVADRPQGGMSFEEGSRNQPPHLDLVRSLDLISPIFGAEVGKAVDGLFW